MKKKLVVVASLLLAMSSVQVMAQKNKKGAAKASIIDENVTIETKNDTLSYSYGVALAESGMKQYLQQLDIDGNPEKMDAFMKGFKESLPLKGSKTAYVNGLSIGDQVYKMANEFSKEVFENDSINNINVNLIAKGISDVLLNNTPQIDSATVIVDGVMAEVNQRKAEIKKQQDQVYIEASKKYMEENKTNEGVVTLPSGLQYRVISQGEGEIPTVNDIVKVNYKGTLTDGTEFDSNYGREPLSLGVAQVIPGWTEALQLMPVGSKWILYIPYNLGYGDRETGPIPAYSNLIFEIDLVDIVK